MSNLSSDLVRCFYSTTSLDVASQSTSPGWDLGKWANYFYLEPSKRDKILNVISLEISGTKLSDMILPPKIVRDLDWVENFWPSTRKGKGHVYPKVQLYCLMGVATAWTVCSISKFIFSGSLISRTGTLILQGLQCIITSSVVQRFLYSFDLFSHFLWFILDILFHQTHPGQSCCI